MDYISPEGMDRRRFLKYAAGVGAIIGLAGGNLDSLGLAQGTSAAMSAHSRMPDGTEYVSWEQPLTFSKTYYVDNNSAEADESGPGTLERPFRTLGKAAEVLQPGERVVIDTGV